ncbi:uncharacterized protein G2W53_014176 [Senna tora]|uniref:Uncharacterized protein n=1 Tax=Senna tora TaxID=362788 RepID=A0A834WT13_9FABA|nr:uncharacterized protein G2W53_014176 [Senna tora]
MLGLRVSLARKGAPKSRNDVPIYSHQKGKCPPMNGGHVPKMLRLLPHVHACWKCKRGRVPFMHSVVVLREKEPWIEVDRGGTRTRWRGSKLGLYKGVLEIVREKAQVRVNKSLNELIVFSSEERTPITGSE